MVALVGIGEAEAVLFGAAFEQLDGKAQRLAGIIGALQTIEAQSEIVEIVGDERVDGIERGEALLAPVEVGDGVAQCQVEFVQRRARLRLFAQEIEIDDAIEVFGFEVVDLIGLRECDVDAVRARDVVVKCERDERADARGGRGELAEQRPVVAFDALFAPVGRVHEDDERAVRALGRGGEQRDRVFGPDGVLALESGEAAGA